MTVEPVSVPSLSMLLPGLPECVAEARRRVVSFAAQHGATAAALARIELAVSEAATNAVVHGYAGYRMGVIRVEADVEGGDLELVVSDRGRGFTGEPVPGLGLGLALVRSGALEFELRDRPQGGVELWARYRLDD